jgi:dUTP pyrophosphatase
MNRVNIKILTEGCMPQRKSKKATGYDLYAAETVTIPAGKTVVVPLGFAMEFGEELDVEIRPRSGLSSRGIININGTIDSDYRGEVGAILININDKDEAAFTINKGDRIAQMVISVLANTYLMETQFISNTERGTNGFGSTGVK